MIRNKLLKISKYFFLKNKFIIFFSLANQRIWGELQVIMIGVLYSLILPITLAEAQIFEGRVVRISDGDTLILLDGSNRQQKIRLSGIDAPEKGQPYGTASKRVLADLVYGRTVISQCIKRDKYERHVCRILLYGLDVNLEQVRKGYAWHYRKYQDEQPLSDRLVYSEAEKKARSARIGLWSDKNPLAPWDFRKEKKFSQKILSAEKP